MKRTLRFIILALVGWSVSSFSRASFFPSISWTANGAQPVTSTSTVITSTYSVNHNISQVGGSAVSTGASGIMKVALTDGAGNSITSAASALAVLAAQSGTWTVQPGNTQNTTGWVFVSTAPIPAGGVVSSTTLLGALTQGTTASASLDSMRRVMTTGCPYTVISTTWTVNIATGTADVVIISSAAAQTRNFIVGILCENTSATNTDLSFYQGFSSNTPAFAKFLGVPANYVPVGRDLRCEDPWFWSQAGGQITVKPGASVSAIKCAIDYYNAP